jgi:cytochrome P450
MGTLNFCLPIPLSLQGVHVIGDPQLAKQILSDEAAEKPRIVCKVFDVLCCGARTLVAQPNNDCAKAVRKSAFHAFPKNEVGCMNEIALKCVNQWLDGRMKQLADSDATFDPAHEMTRITFFSICESAFEHEAAEEEFEEFAHCAEASGREFGIKLAANPL